MRNKNWYKKALALSSALFVLWWALGTSATLAWFSDTDSVRNEFQVGLLKMDVYFKNDVVTQYKELEGTEEAFNDQALYEPGYTQVVYLRIDNLGDVAFNYKVAVTVKGTTDGETAWGDSIYLPNYLRYGVVFGETEEAVRAQVKDRLTAQAEADQDGCALGTWSEISPYTMEVTDKSHYAALIVYMPESVGNEANYRGKDIPTVLLGISVFAQQANADLE